MFSKRGLIIAARFLYYTLLPFCTILIGDLLSLPHTQNNALADLHDPVFWKVFYAPILGLGLLIAVADLSYTIKNGRPGPLIDPAISCFIAKIAGRRGG